LPWYPPDTGFAERRRRPNEGFDHKASGNRDIGARAGFSGAELQRLPGCDREAGPQLDRRSVERRRHVRSGDGNHRGRVEQQRWTDELTLERRRTSIVADEQICQPERPMIHRTGRREAGSKMPEAPGIILHRRLEARLDDFDRHQNRSERSSFAAHALYLATENV
jgi:hypothetical protein